MINAKQEFLDHIKERCVGGRTVRCAKISIHNLKNSVSSVLPVGYTPEDQEEFFKEACKELETRTQMGFEWIPGANWAQCH